MNDNSDGSDDQGKASILLAEYSALRAEIERRSNIQWNVFALQVTTAGTIAGLAISQVSMFALLLLVPWSSFMFGSRYILHDFHIRLISRYVRDSLSTRLDGQLQWDSWKKASLPDNADRRWFSPIGWNITHPTRLAFEGIAVTALIAVAGAAVHEWLSGHQQWYLLGGLTAGWSLGVAITWLLHNAFERSSSA